jgi:hypothetical protein
MVMERRLPSWPVYPNGCFDDITAPDVNHINGAPDGLEVRGS